MPKLNDSTALKAEAKVEAKVVKETKDKNVIIKKFSDLITTKKE